MYVLAFDGFYVRMLIPIYIFIKIIFIHLISISGTKLLLVQNISSEMAAQKKV
jgi:hypothetical protein